MRTDAELVEAAAADDRSAWDELVVRHGQLVYANARAVGADPAMAHDVAQVVWLRLLHRLTTIREPAKIRGWLAIVARNTARDELRRQRSNAPLDAVVNMPDPAARSVEDTAILGESVEALRRGLKALTDRCRELLTLLFSAQMSYEEVVTAMEIPMGSIGPTKRRCLDRLREQMESEESA